ncbi:hypothetical protein IKG13_02455 [Candidatus Saccharibacteria bacterium]|nr:hypothetical protein [Candidatus Saccharibacteria bacterium]MBR3378161.1 hypothetical protein [Candidatus Saccharibacteria bacterium]
MAGFDDDYYREDGDFDDAGNSDVESAPDDYYDNSFFQPDEVNHPLYLNGKAVGGNKRDNLRARRDAGKNTLKNAENIASKKPNINGKGGDKKASLGEKEKNVGTDKTDGQGDGKINNAVKGAQQLKQGRVIKAAGNFKKAGPITTIIVLLAMAGISSFTGQMAMPFSFMTQIRETFDSISTSQGIRSKTFLRFQTGKQKRIKCIKAHYFRADEFKPSKRLESRLSRQGITFEDDGNGTRVMRYKKSDSDPGRVIVADDSQADSDKISFRQLYDSDSDFRRSYDTGSSIWRTATSAWYDSSMKPFLQKIGIKSRSTYDGFKPDTDESEQKFKDAISDNNSSSEGVKSTVTGTEIEDDVEGGDKGRGASSDEKPVKKRTAVESSETLSVEDTKPTADGSDPPLKGKLTGIAKSAISGSTAIANIYCAASDAVGAITAVVAAYQTLQVIQMASSMLEGIQKAQTEDSPEAPIHEISNSLTKRTENTYEEVKSVKKDEANSIIDPVFTEDEVVSVTRERSAMEANGVSTLYSGKPTDYNDPSVKSFNTGEMTANMWKAFSNPGVMGEITGALGSLASSFDVSASSFRSCTVAKLAAASVNLLIEGVETVKSIVECVGTGVGCIVGIVEKAGKEFAKAALKSIIATVVASFVIKHVTKVLMRNIVTDVAGEDLGNAIVDGANAYMGRNHQYSGGAVANKDSLVSYWIEQDKVIADEARFERESRSPFDVTSKYTFFGSLATQMIPLASKMTSITSSLEGMGNVINNAVSSLIPSSSAVSAGIRAQAASDRTEKINPDLYDIGGVGDAFGNPYIITDTSTLGNHPADIVNDVDALSNNETGEKKNLIDVSDEDGDNIPKIGEESNLAKYIQFCGSRQSPFGMGDQNIANNVDKVGSFGGTVGQTIINSTPIFGDLADIASNTNKLENMGWISGESCVIGNTQEGSDNKSPGWDESKKYQRFIEDQRLAEAEGIIEKSAVSEYLAEYYEKNPIDNSFEGVLARYSGLTKENVVATIDLMDVMDFVASYKPADLYPYLKNNQSETEIQFENKYDIQSFDVLVVKNAVYDTNRYKNFAT